MIVEALQDGERSVGEIMDAILYLGSGPDEMLNESPEALNDAVYQAELKRRRGILEQLRR